MISKRDLSWIARRNSWWREEKQGHPRLLPGPGGWVPERKKKQEQSPLHLLQPSSYLPSALVTEKDGLVKTNGLLLIA